MEQNDALKRYMDENYDKSVFDELQESGAEWALQLHGHQTVKCSVKVNNKYDVVVKTKTQDRLPITKHTIKFLYSMEHQEELEKRIKVNKKVKKEELDPILNPRKRNHIKNKTLFPLMKERKVLEFTTLEGDIVAGIVGGFSRYEITILGKGGVPIVLLRHAVHDVRDKRNRCYLKRSVEEKKVIVRKRKSVGESR
jgi:hypothetical protein